MQWIKNISINFDVRRSKILRLWEQKLSIAAHTYADIKKNWNLQLKLSSLQVLIEERNTTHLIIQSL